MPQTYAVIERQGRRAAVCGIDRRARGVCRQAHARKRGPGILVVAHRLGDRWITSGERGDSTGGTCSTICRRSWRACTRSVVVRTESVIEERIMRHAAFEQIAVGGTPDIRVVVYRNVPAMAMVRLPTQASRGRANLHQGAVAAGIELHTGRTTGRRVEIADASMCTRTPSSPSRDGSVPHWNEVLAACRFAWPSNWNWAMSESISCSTRAGAHWSRSQCPSGTGHPVGQSPGHTPASGHNRRIPGGVDSQAARRPPTSNWNFWPDWPIRNICAAAPAT